MAAILLDGFRRRPVSTPSQQTVATLIKVVIPVLLSTAYKQVCYNLPLQGSEFSKYIFAVIPIDLARLIKQAPRVQEYVEITPRQVQVYCCRCSSIDNRRDEGLETGGQCVSWLVTTPLYEVSDFYDVHSEILKDILLDLLYIVAFLRPLQVHEDQQKSLHCWRWSIKSEAYNYPNSCLREFENRRMHAGVIL